MDITPLLVKMVEKSASDLFISVGAPPHIKVEGQSLALGHNVITSSQAQELIYSIMTDDQSKEFESNLELNMALNLPKVGRFRVNIYRQKGEPAIVARFIKSEVPSIEALGLPVILKELVMEQRGLVLLVGGTGTGKSTTLASMLDYRNNTSTGHILTIEDPIEVIHEHKKSLVDQREVGLDTHSYENALKNAMREAPDVIMIGEIRDVDTMKHALAYAETGHLCLATLHANNANQTIDRILNFFPDSAHRQILMDMSLHLRAIVSQRLAVGLSSKRVAAVEVMLNTPYIAELVQKGKIDKIKEAMNQAEERGCQTFDSALYQLAKNKKISQDEALRLADSRNNLALKFRLEKGSDSGDELPPLEKEITFNEQAPFGRYETFKATAIKVAQIWKDVDSVTVIEDGIAYALTQKGFKADYRKPDLEVQFAFTTKVEKGLAVEPIDNEVSNFNDVMPESERHGVLMINIVDTRTNKPVWRVKASRKLAQQRRPQDEINQDFMVMFDEFPPE